MALRGVSSGVVLAALARGACSRAELQALLGVSQATMSRLISGLGAQVAVLGRGAATRYGAVRVIARLGGRIPLYRVTAAGGVVPFGVLVPLMAGEFWCEFVGRPGVLHPGLPHFLADMRPQGFMGRAFAGQFAAELGLPARLNDWNDDAHLLALALHGGDVAGNLMVGEQSLRQFYQGQEDAWAGADRALAYPAKAAANMGAVPGSSVGGEQPKFTHAWRDDAGEHHAIVKFSPAGNTPAAQRWRDLLRAEKLALDLLHEHGVAAAKAQLLEAGGRLFLEVERFDRVGARGRRGLLSLGAIDDHRFGRRDNWAECAQRMLRERMITAAEAQQLVLLDTFGALIANTDRHFGNVSLFIEDFAYSLAPAYDMLPMRYRPDEEGAVPPRDFAPPYPGALNQAVWPQALQMALAYWQRLATQPLLSAEFAAIAAQNSRTLARICAETGVETGAA